jgi:hypothetical protein
MNTEAPVTPSLAVEMWRELRKQRDKSLCREWGTPEEMYLYRVLTKSLSLQSQIAGIVEIETPENNQ